ncbi:MAG: hypothetical protein V4723_21655 [Pseudomonadota bacterium]
MGRRLVQALCTLAALFSAGAVQAHMMEAGHGAVRLVGDSAYLTVALPVAALRGVDDNQDGLLDKAEIDTHRAEISAQVSVLLKLEHGGAEGRVIFEDFLLSHAHEAGAKGEATLVALRRYQWSVPLSSLGMKVGLFGTPALADASLRVRALEGKRSEVVVFSRQTTQHLFFAAAPAK